VEESVNPSHFKPGRGKTGGRQAGVRNRTTRLLKECVLLAAELEGSDGEGKDGLIGFLRRIAKDDLRTFAMLLGRVLPLQVETRTDIDEHDLVAYKTVEEVRRELEESGITPEMLRALIYQPMMEDDDLNVVRLRPDQCG
jgi:hypothetical protein